MGDESEPLEDGNTVVEAEPLATLPSTTLITVVL